MPINLLDLLSGEEEPKLSKITINKSNPMPTVVKKLTGPGMSGVSISSGGSSSSFSTTMPKIKIAELAKAYYSLG